MAWNDLLDAKRQVARSRRFKKGQGTWGRERPFTYPTGCCRSLFDPNACPRAFHFGMPLSLHSHQLAQLLPPLRSGVRSAHLRSTYADEALQQSISAITPDLERLMGLTERERSAYAFVVGARTAMSLRKRIGREVASGTDAEVNAWQRRTLGSTEPTLESWLKLRDSLESAPAFANNLSSRDAELHRQRAGEGPSEGDAGKSRLCRVSVAARLRSVCEALGRAWHGITSWLRYSK